MFPIPNLVLSPHPALAAARGHLSVGPKYFEVVDLAIHFLRFDSRKKSHHGMHGTDIYIYIIYKYAQG